MLVIHDDNTHKTVQYIDIPQLTSSLPHLLQVPYFNYMFLTKQRTYIKLFNDVIDSITNVVNDAKLVLNIPSDVQKYLVKVIYLFLRSF